VLWNDENDKPQVCIYCGYCAPYCPYDVIALEEILPI
jgi:carbon-monoxide dehydrogenase iron sulfur subunit